jgi:hypothetical protein
MCLDQLPKRLIIGCVDSNALNGTITKSPFDFKHYKITVNISLDKINSIFDIHVTEYDTALTTILLILFLYLNTVIVTAGTGK